MGKSRSSCLRGEIVFAIGVPQRSHLEKLFHEELMPRLELSFKRNCNSATGIFDPLRLYGPFCDLAAARMGIMLIQEGIKVDVNMSASHVSLIYNDIIIDPTFYQWYTLSPADENIPRYTDRNGTTCQFTAQEVSSGFVGTKNALLAFFLDKRPMSGTLLLPSGWQARDDLLDILVKQKYLDQDSVVRAQIDSDIRPDEMGRVGSAFWSNIQIAIKNWIEYNDPAAIGKIDHWEKKDCYLRPLKMEIPLDSLKQMNWCESAS